MVDGFYQHIVKRAGHHGVVRCGQADPHIFVCVQFKAACNVQIQHALANLRPRGQAVAD